MLLTKCRVTIKAPKKKRSDVSGEALHVLHVRQFPRCQADFVFVFLLYIFLAIGEKSMRAQHVAGKDDGQRARSYRDSDSAWLRLVSRRVPQRAAPSAVPPSSSLCLFQRRRRCRLVALSSLSRRVAESQNNRAAIKKKSKKNIEKKQRCNSIYGYINCTLDSHQGSSCAIKGLNLARTTPDAKLTANMVSSIDSGSGYGYGSSCL